MLYLVAAFVVLLVVYVAFAAARRREADRSIPVVPPEAAAGGAAYAVDPAADEDRLNPRPRAPEQTADECWVPPGRTVTVRGYTIERGMVYVGAGLYKDRVAWKPEDCLIDPTLEVSAANPDREGRTVPAWPAYGKLNPSGRAAFLEWLARGADAADAPLGFVMLYFYGLERRLLHDEIVAPEAERLVEEVHRLRGVYARHRLFDQASRALLDRLAHRDAARTNGSAG